MMWLWLICGSILWWIIVAYLSAKLGNGLYFISIPLILIAAGLAWKVYGNVWSAVWRGVFFPFGYIAWYFIGEPWLMGD